MDRKEDWNLTARENISMEKFYPISPLCCSFNSFSFSLLWNISRHDIPVRVINLYYCNNNLNEIYIYIYI